MPLNSGVISNVDPAPCENQPQVFRLDPPAFDVPSAQIGLYDLGRTPVLRDKPGPCWPVDDKRIVEARENSPIKSALDIATKWHSSRANLIKKAATRLRLELPAVAGQCLLRNVETETVDERGETLNL